MLKYLILLSALITLNSSKSIHYHYHYGTEDKIQPVTTAEDNSEEENAPDLPDDSTQTYYNPNFSDDKGDMFGSEEDFKMPSNFSSPLMDGEGFDFSNF